ncbi:hypothetical protein STAS_33618 [Striga asiatica]|uniref:Always early n=1 Tax=Striga asiatica TaxID=4170 RepID=A0A5A7RFG9_STRAF|nr:hypothetical protein STAS_33618 [Striga asiatica]
MGPTRNCKSLNKRYSYVPDVSPSKDGDGSKRSNRRKVQKRKLSDMLGPRWTVEELTRFYDSYRKNGKDWKKLASAVRNRSPEMVEALYTMNRAYLSLPHGTASATGLIAMMTDHYSNLAGSDSDQESNDEVRSSRKPQKRARCKVEPPTSKASDSQFLSPTLGSSYGCLSLLKKKRSGGSRPRPVGKRTPRFPISLPYDTMSEDKYFSPTRKGLQLNANADDDEVAHEIAIALAEASQRGGSPQVSGTPNKRAESVMSSPIRHSQRKNYLAEMANTKLLSADMDEEDLEGSTEADTGELFKYKSNVVEFVSPGTTREKGKKLKGKKFEIENNDDRHLDDTKEECSGTEEDQKSGVIRGKFDLEANTNISKSPMQSQRKKSKKVLFGKVPTVIKMKAHSTFVDEEPAFDALQALADLSLMLPMENEDESRVLLKEEPDDVVDESVPLESQPANQPREKRKSTGVKVKGHLSSFGAASSKRSKPGKSSALDAFSVPEENQDSIQSNTNKVRRKQKVQVSKNAKPESHGDILVSGSPGNEEAATEVSADQVVVEASVLEAAAEAGDSEALITIGVVPRCCGFFLQGGDAGKKLKAKNKKSSQNSSPKLMKVSENSSSADMWKEGSDSAQSAIQVPAGNQVTLPTKVRSRRKMNLKKPVQEESKLLGKIHPSNLPLGSLHDTMLKSKEMLSNCLLNQRLRRWCTYEWFYSAIDYPWFAKREFVEYLYHVGLGHVPTLTRVEWGVIRSSLGKPRRFSEQFLKEEKEKLNQYRDSVRRHYTELREGIRDGLPTDLARPLSVGQRVIAIHPKTRDINDGSVLTVDHYKCRVQFDRPELGVEFVKDIDCMPLNPFENMPALVGRHTVPVDKFTENINELKMNGHATEYIKFFPGDNLDNKDGLLQLSSLANPATKSWSTPKLRILLVHQVVSANANVNTGIGVADIASYNQTSNSPLQAKEADIQALADLTRALDKKEAIVIELKRMNDDVLENQKDGGSPLKESESFKKQYAAVLIQLNEANEQVTLALRCLRERNTYQGKFLLTSARPVAHLADPCGTLNSACQSHEVGSQMNEIMDSSRSKARMMVNAAVQAITSLESQKDTLEKIEEAIDYVNDQLPLDGTCLPRATDPKLTNASDDTRIPSELITKCVATLLMIQKCTERQFPPSDVAQILDSAVTSLQPRSSQNLPIYTEIQKCVGIIKNQILALIPT